MSTKFKTTGDECLARWVSGGVANGGEGPPPDQWELREGRAPKGLKAPRAVQSPFGRNRECLVDYESYVI